MKTKLRNILRQINASVILAAIFLFFIVFVGAATIPTVVSEASAVLHGEKSIKSGAFGIRAAYDEMLTTSLDQSVLQNRATYVNLSGFIANLLGQRQLNEVVKLNNGYLTSIYARQSTDVSVERITAICKKQTEKGGTYLFVLAPTKISKFDNQLPPDIKDYANDNADDLVNGLRKNGVPVLDLRDELHAQGISHEEAFNKTDHHWTPQTGFWAYVEIFKKLESMGAVSGIPDYLLDSSNYEFYIFHNSFLGSMGKRTGIYYAGVDDICKIIPKFDTNMSVSIPNGELDATGRYEDVAYAVKDFGGTDYFNQRSYSSYGYGNRAMIHWSSAVAPVDKRFMVYGDSFGNVPFTLFALCVQTCDELDMRHYRDDFAAYYQAFDPDVVVCLVNVQEVSSDSEDLLYDFFPNG